MGMFSDEESSLFIGMGQEDFHAVLKEIEKQNDRAAALLSVSLLEIRVKQAIEGRIKVRDKKLRHLIGNSEKPGELAFLDQCRLAYCLGAFGPETFKDLEKMAQIRNRFAHRFAALTFDDPKIRALSMSLTTMNRQVLQLQNDFAPDDTQLSGSERRKLRHSIRKAIKTIPRERFLYTFRYLHACIWISTFFADDSVTYVECADDDPDAVDEGGGTDSWWNLT
jgi:hypothetical protein